MEKYFILRFVRADNQPNEDYYYHNRQDAEEHYNLFLHDDSGLYNSIEIIEEEL